MNLAKLVSILDGDPIEDWLERQQRRLEARGLAWLPKVALAVLTVVIVGAILSFRP